MTQFEKFKSIDIDTFAEWLDRHIEFGSSPWCQWFDETYCQKCQPIMCKYEDGRYEFPCAYCEVNGGCRFFDKAPSGNGIAKLWLEREVEE